MGRPARVDAETGCRFYLSEPVEPARFVGLLRRLAVPRETIGVVVRGEPADSFTAIAAWWEGVAAATAERRAYSRISASG